MSAEFGKLNCQPPAIRTLPFGSRAAVWSARETVIGPVGENVPLLGSYSSALAVAPSPISSPIVRVADASAPPAMSTFPLGRRVAVCPARAVDMSPAVGMNVRLSGSYNSARRSDVFPPTTSTWPLKRVVAVGDPARGTAMLPTGIHWADATVGPWVRLGAIFPFGA
jgi:hypothetical protein